MKLLQGRLPDPPRTYQSTSFHQLIRKLREILNIDVETKEDADDKEAIDFFLSK